MTVQELIQKLSRLQLDKEVHMSNENGLTVNVSKFIEVEADGDEPMFYMIIGEGDCVGIKDASE